MFQPDILARGAKVKFWESEGPGAKRSMAYGGFGAYVPLKNEVLFQIPRGGPKISN